MSKPIQNTENAPKDTYEQHVGLAILCGVGMCLAVRHYESTVVIRDALNVLMGSPENARKIVSLMLIVWINAVLHVCSLIGLEQMRTNKKQNRLIAVPLGVLFGFTVINSGFALVNFLGKYWHTPLVERFTTPVWNVLKKVIPAKIINL